MTADSSTNVKDYFRHQIMIPVPGKIIYRTLVQLQKEVCANRKSVPSILGGSAQGHLGLVTFASTYARINPNSVFTRPAHPRPLVQVTNATQLHISKAVSLHKENIGQFNLFCLFERTSIQKINAAVDSKFLADLIDNKTALLTGTIP